MCRYTYEYIYTYYDMCGAIVHDATVIMYKSIHIHREIMLFIGKPKGRSRMIHTIIYLYITYTIYNIYTYVYLYIYIS